MLEGAKRRASIYASLMQNSRSEFYVPKKMNKHSKPVLKQFVTVTSHFFCIVLSGHSSFKRISGDAGYVVPPVPIPNTVVKHIYAESTCLETDWEDRELPVKRKASMLWMSFFFAKLMK